MREDDSSQSKLIIFGAAITVAYIVGHAIYLFSVQDNILAMDPNEYGDFLAGLFAPLAFLWLVLGFFQQGRELKNSSDALNLQVRELRASVEQSERLVEVTSEQLALDREVIRDEKKRQLSEVQPKLRLKKERMLISGDDLRLTFDILNVGGECYDVVGQVPAPGHGNLTTFGTERLNKENRIGLTFDVDLRVQQKVTISVSYYDQFGGEHSIFFDVDIIREEGSVRVNFPSIPSTATTF